MPAADSENCAALQDMRDQCTQALGPKPACHEQFEQAQQLAEAGNREGALQLVQQVMATLEPSNKQGLLTFSLLHKAIAEGQLG